MKKKIAYFYIWSSPPFVQSVARMLAGSFPEYDLEPVGIGKLLRKRPGILLLNELLVARYYGLDILAGRKKHNESVVATPFLFKQVRQLILDLFGKRDAEYAFSFQFQSLFDTSLPGLPHFVYTDHTVLANLGYPGFDRRTLYHPAWIDLEKQVYQHAKRVFTLSTNITRSVVEQYGCPSEKVVCVYAGSNAPPPMDPPDPERYARKQILFVGVDWERKGGPDLVAAFREVQKVHPAARLTIVGCTPRVDLPGCRVVGSVPLDRMAAYYREAALFCMPTRLEPFGVVFLEAMAHQLPVVATRIGAIPDFVVEGKNGRLVEIGDTSGLAQALIDLLGNPEMCRAYGEAGSALVAQRYNWENVGRRVREGIQTA